jgi:archaemetzincin
MRAAINAAIADPTFGQDTKSTSGVWFSRLARTVSHELGHCFGMAHCVYYACDMQSAASMREDVRQPPYLCPICEAKVAHAVVGELHGSLNEEKRTWKRERLTALKGFCGQIEGTTMDAGMWHGLDAWVATRLSGL